MDNSVGLKMMTSMGQEAKSMKGSSALGKSYQFGELGWNLAGEHIAVLTKLAATDDSLTFCNIYA
jgi:hypothetical protein